MDMTREDVIAANPIISVLQDYGLEFRRKGKELVAKCCFHDDSNPSLRVNIEKQLWRCDPCDLGGSVIDFVMAKEKVEFKEAMARLCKKLSHPPSVTKKEVCSYDYCDENGAVLFQKVRYEPKSFSQRHKNSDGQWVYGMDGVRRVLYRLPDVLTATDLFIVEGEKDSDSLCNHGFAATTNSEGSSKWLDSYSDTLKGKNVVVIPDNDEPGRKHAEQIIKSLAGKAAKIFRFEVPAPDKDISDFIKRHNGNAKAKILDLLNALKPINPVPDLPVLSLEEMEADYEEFTQKSQPRTLRIANWLPSLANCVRDLVPGDVVVIAGDTGSMKTALLSNLAFHSGLPVLIFELELPGTRMFERMIQLATSKSGDEIYQSYRQKNKVDWRMCKNLSRLFFCTLSRMEPKEMERIINLAELKMGERPVLVGLDYMQLMQGHGGSRYERASDVAEQMKIIAKSTGTIIVEVSQVSRPFGKAERKEISLHELKDSGSLENSAGLVLGVWIEGSTLKVKVLKNTNGPGGKVITCNYDGGTMKITEQAKIDPVDVPKLKNVINL